MRVKPEDENTPDEPADENEQEDSDGEAYDLLPDEVYKEVVADYYKGVFGLADTARGRSQAAWAIASAVAGLLVTAGLIKNLSNSADVVKALAAASIFAWLATGLVFMWALVKPLPPPPKSPEGDDLAEVKMQFAQRALAFFRTDLNGVQFRQKVAVAATAVAVGVTTAAVATNLAVPPPRELVPATVALNAKGQQVVEALCGDPPHPLKALSGMLDTATLKKDDVVLQVPRKECPKARSKKAEIALPGKDIVGIETRKYKIPMF